MTNIDFKSRDERKLCDVHLASCARFKQRCLQKGNTMIE